GGGRAGDVARPEAPAAELVAVDGEDLASHPEIRPPPTTPLHHRHPKNTDLLLARRRITIDWIVRRMRRDSRRARCQRPSASVGGIRIDFPKCMNHFVGSGSVPSSPRSGKNGVIGT